MNADVLALDWWMTQSVTTGYCPVENSVDSASLALLRHSSARSDAETQA
jgi:hypothetical protein